ncbi:GDP-mannose 4,6-dehydratase [Micromonospora rubida]|uniref:GDP-mannose 4,6-dehydratase n=1 Tax=Micromonospora rubida TaxID=2697657 RepID=UPI001377508C|nr:GDP-mannose 4,6-dehydratase [Micromonospora rubida]NBE82944.1 NAD-dependent epimerase/dehydratase family protein [Micromonospora rubida]
MPTAIVVGADGQDGVLLSRLLRALGYRVVPVGRHGAIDITRPDDVAELVAELRPDEIYLLAAVQNSAQDPVADPVELAHRSYAVNTLAVVHFLEAIDQYSPASKVFYAASSHVFGMPDTPVQDETTPLRPTSVYGISKAAGLLHCRSYRARGVFASVGILYSHESPLRRPGFVSRKIVDAVVRIQRGEAYRLVLGGLAAEVDWGYAADYVDAMRRILSLATPDDYVVASGVRRTVGEFAATAFAAVGLDWRDHVEENAAVLTRPSVPLVGDASRLRAATGWCPSVDFAGMVRALLRAAGADLVETDQDG